MGKIKDKILNTVKSKNFIIGAASFLLPMLALYIIFIFNGVHPFGNRQILVTDLWHQYYPFLCTLQEKLQAGESLLYSETIGMGINFWALIAYYCASPLNFLVGLVTKESLRDLVVVLVTLKVGFSGLFFSMYLKKVFSRYDWSTVAFSMIYALCGYVLGYYWNIMWLDCVALLPLVMLGVYSLIKENKFKLYIISLAVAVISNFYIGFMVCIFTAIYFFAECVKQSLKLKEFFKKLGLIIVTSVVALALTAFMTIPAYLALGNTVSSVPKNTSVDDDSLIENIVDGIEDGAEEFFKDSPDVLGRLASFNEPVPKDGLPNLFSGFISVILFGYFLCSRKIKLREKIATSAVLLLLFASVTVSDIDIIWHGMHKPNMVPYRYAFVFSFAMITMAYRTFVAEFTDYTEGIKKNGRFPVALVLSIIFSAGVIFCANNKAALATILGCMALAIVYFVIIESYYSENSEKMKKKWSMALCGLIVAEMIINTIIAVPTVRTTDYTTYYYRGEEIEKLLEAVDADSSYGRVETSQEYILNDPALYGYKGVSTFTSTANYSVTKLMEKLALCAPARSNRYYYETTSPLTNAFLGIEHVIFKNNMNNLNPYLKEAASEYYVSGENKYKQVIYKNTQSLPIGFMTSGDLLSPEGLMGENPFEIQNDLFRKATGIDEDIFIQIPLENVGGNVKVTGKDYGSYTITDEEKKDKLELRINHLAPDENSVYAYIDGSTFTKVKIKDTSYKVDKRKYIFPAGNFATGEKMAFHFTFADTFKDKTTLKFMVYSLNEKLFEEGMELLRDEIFEITKYESTEIEGTVEAYDDGVFYTSIPFEAGWTLYVDGVKTEITPFENALIAVKLTEGKHDIRLTYSPEGFKVGVVISVIGLVIFIGGMVMLKRRKRNG